MRKLGCNAAALLGNRAEQNMEIIKSVGFERTFFLMNSATDVVACMKTANKTGLEVETIHAPFDKMNDLWLEGENGEDFLGVLKNCISFAGANSVPYVIIHPTFSNVVPATSKIGLLRFEKLLNEAKKHGVKLAFENLEYINHLALIFDTFKDDSVGLCFDAGHENCYTPGIRFLPIFGDRLFCTHLHDNSGMSEEKYMDPDYDFHKIPFDGNVDFERVCNDIKNSGFEGCLMLELNSRGPHNFYKDLSPEVFYAKAYEAALKLRFMTDGE